MGRTAELVFAILCLVVFYGCSETREATKIRESLKTEVQEAWNAFPVSIDIRVERTGK